MKVIIDGISCEAEQGEYILAVAKRNGIGIPTLCNCEALPEMGTCRLCVVELFERNRSKVVASCIYPLTREVEIRTNTPKIQGIRETIIRLLLSRAPENEQLMKLAEKYSLLPRTLPESQEKTEDCVLCGLCAKACEELGSNAIATVGRGIGKKVSTPYDEPSAACIGCGSCAEICPTGAIKLEEQDGIRRIWGKEFELLSCDRCGKPYIPKEYIEYVEKRSGEKLEGHYCSSCRKSITGERFKEIFGL